MKPARSSESVKVRRELAQLLRRLRAIRREKLSGQDLASRFSRAMTEAGSISRFVAFRDGTAGPAAPLPFVDHRKLRAAEEARQVAVPIGVLANRCA